MHGDTRSSWDYFSFLLFRAHTEKLMPMAALFTVCARRVACFIAAWFLALPLAHADPAGDSAALAAGPLSRELESHLWRIDSVIFESSRSRQVSDIYPAGDDGSDAYIMFENGEIRGSLGCGQLTGRYSLSNDRVDISALSSSDRKRCGIEFAERAAGVISALRDAVRLKRGGEDAFHLFDEQKTYFIRLELLSPGFDLSEFSSSFWRLVSLEGNPIAEPDVEVRLDRRGVEVSLGKFRAEFGFGYRLKKLAFEGPSSTRSPGNADPPPFFETFTQALHRIATYSANGDELVAMDVSGQKLMLLRRIRPTGLEYRYWRISGYGADGWLNPTTGFPQSQFVAFARGEVHGSAGCRGLEGNYTFAGDSLSVHVGDHSGTGCDVATENEQRIVLYGFNKASRIKEDGGRMLLQDAQGNTNIVLVPYAQQTPH
jgi:heat shock protein HslJ